MLIQLAREKQRLEADRKQFNIQRTNYNFATLWKNPNPHQIKNPSRAPGVGWGEEHGNTSQHTLASGNGVSSDETSGMVASNTDTCGYANSSYLPQDLCRTKDCVINSMHNQYHHLQYHERFGTTCDQPVPNINTFNVDCSEDHSFLLGPNGKGRSPSDYQCNRFDPETQGGDNRDSSPGSRDIHSSTDCPMVGLFHNYLEPSMWSPTPVRSLPKEQRGMRNHVH